MTAIAGLKNVGFDRAGRRRGRRRSRGPARAPARAGRVSGVGVGVVLRDGGGRRREPGGAKGNEESRCSDDLLANSRGRTEAARVRGLRNGYASAGGERPERSRPGRRESSSGGGRDDRGDARGRGKDDGRAGPEDDACRPTCRRCSRARRTGRKPGATSSRPAGAPGRADRLRVEAEGGRDRKAQRRAEREAHPAGRVSFAAASWLQSLGSPFYSPLGGGALRLNRMPA